MEWNGMKIRVYGMEWNQGKEKILSMEWNGMGGHQSWNGMELDIEI